MGTTVLVVTHEHELVREFNQRVVTIDKGKVIGDTKNGRFAVGVYDDYEEEYADDAVYADEAGYADDYDGYTGDADFSDEEIIESYEGLGYDDDADVGEFEPQYPDNVVILPDDDERLGS